MKNINSDIEVKEILDNISRLSRGHFHAYKKDYIYVYDKYDNERNVGEAISYIPITEVVEDVCNYKFRGLRLVEFRNQTIPEIKISEEWYPINCNEEEFPSITTLESLSDESAYQNSDDFKELKIFMQKLL